MKSLRACFLMLLLAVSAIQAHETRPGYLQITETQPGQFQVVWKVPQRGDLVLRLHVQWPAACRDVAPVTREMLGNAVIEQRLLECGTSGLIGQRLAIDGLATTITDVLARLAFLDGRRQTNLMTPGSPSFVVQGQRPSLEVAYEYVRLGVEHILLGIDHLLFVLGLLLIVPNRWLLLKTITAFTLAHSLTLGLATLGYASAPMPPLNAAIALSILFLAPEIVRSWRGETSFTIRHPWLVAFAFGLLHGFGFASGLTSVGLPRAEIPLALLWFNVGVELGQMACVALILLLERSFRTLEIRWPRWAELVPGYAVGTLGAYWTIERTFALMGWT